MISRFIFKTLFITILFFAILFVPAKLGSLYVKNKNFRNYETGSNTLIIKKYKRFNLLIMGISHARNFTRYKNHLRIEKILNKKVINIGQGAGICGTREQLFYLDYFYSQKNKVDTILYILSPPLLFSETLPISSVTFNNESFEFDFFINYLFFETENKSNRLNSYIKSKFKMNWLNYSPETIESKNKKIVCLDSSVVERGFDLAYPNGLKRERYKKSCADVETTIKLAKTNSTEVILLIPPALFGKWPGHSQTEAFAKKMVLKYQISYYDFSESVLIPEYYYDHHHLNSNGIVFFTEKYLKPLL